MTTDVIEATIMALEKIPKEYCTLSQIDYSKLDVPIIESAKKEKYLERPFAYEFYHQLRKLMECDAVNFGDCIIQAEVDKRYQHCFGKIPDFIIHIPDKTDKNLAVLEFKLTSNLGKIREDFDKLVKFKEHLKYEHIIEVVIGGESSLKVKTSQKEKQSNAKYEEITIIEFNTDSGKADDWKDLDDDCTICV